MNIRTFMTACDIHEFECKTFIQEVTMVTTCVTAITKLMVALRRKLRETLATATPTSLWPSQTQAPSPTAQLCPWSSFTLVD